MGSADGEIEPTVTQTASGVCPSEAPSEEHATQIPSEEPASQTPNEEPASHKPSDSPASQLTNWITCKKCYVVFHCKYNLTDIL